MSRHLFPLLIAMVCAAGCGRSPAQRTIAYNAARPIAERLLPGDTAVRVEMKLATPSADSTPQRSFEQEIQELRRGEVILLVRIASTLGEVADRGTWVRTRVTAGVERIVKAPSDKPPGESIEFTFSGGSTRIKNVAVTTGKFPQLSDGEQYLVVLQTRPGDRSSLVWTGTGFRVDAQGALRRVTISEGGEQTFPTNLVGRNVSEVIAALER